MSCELILKTGYFRYPDKFGDGENTTKHSDVRTQEILHEVLKADKQMSLCNQGITQSNSAFVCPLDYGLLQNTQYLLDHSLNQT